MLWHNKAVNTILSDQSTIQCFTTPCLTKPYFNLHDGHWPSLTHLSKQRAVYQIYRLNSLDSIKLSYITLESIGCHGKPVLISVWHGMTQMLRIVTTLPNQPPCHHYHCLALLLSLVLEPFVHQQIVLASWVISAVLEDPFFICSWPLISHSTLPTCSLPLHAHPTSSSTLHLLPIYKTFLPHVPPSSGSSGKVVLFSLFHLSLAQWWTPRWSSGIHIWLEIALYVPPASCSPLSTMTDSSYPASGSVWLAVHCSLHQLTCGLGQVGVQDADSLGVSHFRFGAVHLYGNLMTIVETNQAAGVVAHFWGLVAQFDWQMWWVLLRQGRIQMSWWDFMWGATYVLKVCIMSDLMLGFIWVSKITDGSNG